MINILNMSYINALLVILLPLLVNGWNFHFSKNDESACPFPAVSLQDIKDAVWSAKESYGNHGVGYVIPQNQYKITHVISKKYKRANVKVIVAEKSNTVVIAFMGSDGTHQIQQEMESVLENPEGIGINIAGKNTRVVEYFWDVFVLLRNNIDAVDSLRSLTKKYIITGHSLGGALASLFAIYAMVDKANIWHNRRSSLITFGEPRVGDGKYAELHDTLILPSRKVRLINENDIVPHLPPFIMDYRQHSRGVWMESKSRWRVCQRDESLTSCSNRNFFHLNAKDHAIARYIESITNIPQSIDVCLSIFSNCKTYGDLSSALHEACND